MRAWDIALFFFLVSFAGALVNDIGLFTGANTYLPPVKLDTWANPQHFNSTVEQKASPAPTGTVSITDSLASLLGGGWFLFQSIGMFFTLIGTAITFPMTLGKPPFNLPVMIVSIISASCYICYTAAVIEFLSARRIGA